MGISAKLPYEQIGGREMKLSDIKASCIGCNQPLFIGAGIGHDDGTFVLRIKPCKTCAAQSEAFMAPIRKALEL